jgi:uncharacterized SAM-binding protein YcdF (DUF218 family)
MMSRGSCAEVKGSVIEPRPGLREPIVGGAVDGPARAFRARVRALRVTIAAAAIVLAAAAWSARTVPLRWLGGALVHEDAIVATDVAVVSMASAREAALDAAKLQRRGLVREIWIPRWRADRVDRRVDALGVHVPRPHDVARSILARAGVPSSAIVTLDEPITGLESEMASVGRALRARPGLRVLVLTARTHTARARMLLRDWFAPAARVSVHAPHGDGFAADAWWRDRSASREVALESLKWARLLASGPSMNP